MQTHGISSKTYYFHLLFWDLFISITIFLFNLLFSFYLNNEKMSHFSKEDIYNIIVISLGSILWINTFINRCKDK